MRVRGAGTAAIARKVRPGVRVWVSVPQGPRVPDDGRDVVLVGAGAGIGPMVSVAQAAFRTSPPSRRIAVVARVSGLEDVPDMAGLPYWVSVGPRQVGTWVGPEGSIFHLGELGSWVGDARVVVCGPPGWCEAVVAQARGLGVPVHMIISEGFE